MILFMIDEKLAEHPVSKNMLKNFEQISPILSVCFIINTGNVFPWWMNMYQFQFSSNRENRVT